MLVTGLCECVSAIGPLLGGGHSILQAKHGFAADNLVSARLVLADGKAITVSETENRELFWAVRGAGHNFGIVTSFDIKVYDAKGSEWTIVSFAFSQDKLEDVFAAWNTLEDENPDRGLLLVNSIINRTPDTDPHHVSTNKRSQGFEIKDGRAIG
jgi:FAD/FMN-containing dehydrogenase